MKRSVLLFSFFLLAFATQAQVFNTASTLKKGSFSLGLEPVVYVSGASEGFNMFVHGGIGIQSGIDLGIKAGVLGSTNYFGADLEWKLAKNVSLTTGAHSFADFGLDAALNISFPLTKGAQLYTGIDADINFGNEIYVPLWVPVGVELSLKKSMAFILEAEIGISDVAYHIFGGGLAFYF
ncbi:MAG: hypothetical protein HC896_11085 [Bacteroidales bacterium]|nr:hypothetical protein [Bacteroidales bacterium]